eukprot:TRINITY_DN7697_c2_g1_i2.p1 TRINITY_DN7697_c2_g1~~TRINITY_DN7697_c2_g1_i2.p1  ORF type:complete len:1388 (+),score=348.46 TRINITY_DN7697_c2_g1_i2:522-4685(+)
MGCVLPCAREDDSSTAFRGDNRRRALQVAESLGVLTPHQRQAAERMLAGEQVEWLTKLAQALWPRARDPTSRLVQGMLQERLGKSWTVDKVDLGAATPDFGPVMAMVVDGGVVLAVGVSYQPDREKGMRIDVGPLGLRDTSIHGTLLIRLVPLVYDAPWIGGFGVGFANSPEIDFEWTGIGVPILPTLLRNVIVDSVNDNIVAPHFHSVNLAPSQVDPLRLGSPDPIGVLRVNVISASRLCTPDEDCMAKYRGLSPVVEVQIGAARWTTPPAKPDTWRQSMHTLRAVRGANPRWDEPHFFVVHSMEQWVKFDVYDSASGDRLGQARWPVRKLLEYHSTEPARADESGVCVLPLMKHSGLGTSTLSVAGVWYTVAGGQQPRVEEVVCLASVRVEAVAHIPPRILREGPFVLRAKLLPEGAKASSEGRRGLLSRMPGQRAARERLAAKEQSAITGPEQAKEELTTEYPGPAFNQVLHVPGLRNGTLVLELVVREGHRVVAVTEGIPLGAVTGERLLGGDDPYAPPGELIEVRKQSRKRRDVSVCGQVIGGIWLQRLETSADRLAESCSPTSAPPTTPSSEGTPVSVGDVDVARVRRQALSGPCEGEMPSSGLSKRESSEIEKDRSALSAGLTQEQSAALHQCMASGALTWERFELLRRLSDADVDVADAAHAGGQERQEDTLAWANVLCSELWPLVRPGVARKLQEHIDRVLPWHINRVSRRTKFGAILRALKVKSSVDLGQEVPRLNTISTRRVPDGAELIISFVIRVRGSAGGGVQFRGSLAGFSSAEVQLRDIVLKGRMVVSLRHFISTFPFFSSVDVGFLDTPNLDFLLSGSLFYLPIHSIIPSTLLQRAIFGEVVLPSRLNLRLSRGDEMPTRDVARLAMGRRPQGMVRIFAWLGDGIPVSAFRPAPCSWSDVLLGQRSGVYVQAACGGELLRTQIVHEGELTEDGLPWQILSPELDLLVHHSDQNIMLLLCDAADETIGMATMRASRRDSSRSRVSSIDNMSFGSGRVRLSKQRGIPAYQLRDALLHSESEPVLLNLDKADEAAQHVQAGSPSHRVPHAVLSDKGSPATLRVCAQWLEPPENISDARDIDTFLLSVTFARASGSICGAGPNFAHQYKVHFIARTGQHKEVSVADLCRPPRAQKAPWFDFDMDITRHTVARCSKPPRVRVELRRHGELMGTYHLFRGFEGEHAGPFHVVQHGVRVCTVHAAVELIRMRAIHPVTIPSAPSPVGPAGRMEASPEQGSDPPTPPARPQRLQDRRRTIVGFATPVRAPTGRAAGDWDRDSADSQPQSPSPTADDAVSRTASAFSWLGGGWLSSPPAARRPACPRCGGKAQQLGGEARRLFENAQGECGSCTSVFRVGDSGVVGCSGCQWWLCPACAG